MKIASLQFFKLKNHRDKKHPQRKDDDTNVLFVKKVQYDLKVTLLHLGFTVVKNPLQFSYKVGYEIAKCKKPHTIAEELIKPCAERKVKMMIGSGAKKKIQQVSPSNDTIRQQIDEITANV